MSNQVYSNDTTKYPVSPQQLPANVVYTDTTQTLTNKTLTTPSISTILNTGTLTLPTTTGTLVGRTTVDTLTNKTLAAPLLQAPSVQAVAVSNQLSSTVLGFTGAGVVSSLSDSCRYPQWSQTTVGAGSFGFALPASLDNPFTVRSYVTGIVTVGPLAGNLLYREISSLISVAGGFTSWVLDFNTISANQNAGTAAAFITHVASSNTVSPVVNGIAGNTIVWYGSTRFAPK